MAYLRRKIVFYVVALWAALTLNFIIPRLIPGSPVDAILARQSENGPVSPSEIRALDLLFGVGKGSVWSKYVAYLGGLTHLDFGLSVTYYPTPVTAVIAQALPWTLVLVGVATVLAFALGISLGIVLGWKQGTGWEAFIPGTIFLSAIPYFWLGLVLLYFFASELHVFPLEGGYSDTLDISWTWSFVVSAVYHSLLPAITIVVSSFAGWLLGMRNMMVSTMGEDYVLVAEAKGLRRWRLITDYAARNAILPSVAGFAISLGFVVSGSIVTEIVFSYPGIGNVLYSAVEDSDYPLMQAIFLIISLSVLAANFVADIAYFFLDPRTRRSQ